MNSKIRFFSTIILAVALFGFSNKNEISNCFLSFTTATNLTAAEPERLPETSEKVRTVKTEYGEVEVSRLDGYRILYNNEKKGPFVNLKVELSDPGFYESDQKKVLDNLKYINANSDGMETKELIELNFNGYKIWGLSRGTIEVGNTLGIFIMFPGNGVAIYFYFNNLKPDVRNFASVEDYKKQRDKFIDDYTKHLITCSNR
jgi:hypothetical protein